MTSDSNDNSNIQAAGFSEPAAVACEGGTCEAACAEPTVAEAGASYRRDGQCRIIVDSCADFAPEVARALGCDCILVEGGHQSPAALRASGAPVIPTLAQLPALIDSLRK